MPRRDRVGPPLRRALGTAVAVLMTMPSAACRQDRVALPPAPQSSQLTLAVGSGPGVSPALSALVRLVAEQELRRAELNPRARAESTGVLALILERRRRGASRLNLSLIRPTRLLESRYDINRCCAPTQVAELRRQIRLLVTTVAPQSVRPSRPLWTDSRFTRDQLKDALAAGVHWLLVRTQGTGPFDLSDLQQVFLILRESARDPALRRLAATVGPRLAYRFRKLAPRPRATTSVEKLFDLAAGSYFARRFGVRASPRYRRALARAFREGSPQRLLRRTTAADPARDLLDELVDLYFPFKLDLPMPARYASVVARAARYTFGNPAGKTALELEDRIYLATHIIYVLSDFNESRLREADLPDVVQFLEQVGPLLLAADDVETLGEVGDTLKIVGRGYKNPLIRRIVRRLLQTQNTDGSWGKKGTKNSYKRYHTTWTCFNGLLEFRFAKRGMTDATIRAAWRRGRAARQPKPAPPKSNTGPPKPGM